MIYLTLPLFFFHTAVLAQATSSDVPIVDPVSSGYLIKLTAGLLIVVVLIFGLAWLMKKLQLTQNTHNGLIKIVSAISVGQRDRIALIQVGDEQVLVGLTPGRMQTLHTLKNKVTAEPSAEEPVAGFSEKFNQLLNREPSRDK